MPMTDKFAGKSSNGGLTETTPEPKSQSDHFSGERTPTLKSQDDLTPEELLWRAVLGQAVRDIYDQNIGVRAETLRWMKSEDFEVVCIFANVDPYAMRRQLRNLAELPIHIAKKYGQILRSQIIRD